MTTASLTELGDALVSRDVDNGHALAAKCDPERGMAAVAYFDKQRNAGPGLLAKLIREGGRKPDKPEPPKRAFTEHIAWAEANVPDLLERSDAIVVAAIAKQTTWSDHPVTFKRINAKRVRRDFERKLRELDEMEADLTERNL